MSYSDSTTCLSLQEVVNQLRNRDHSVSSNGIYAIASKPTKEFMDLERHDATVHFLSVLEHLDDF